MINVDASEATFCGERNLHRIRQVELLNKQTNTIITKAPGRDQNPELLYYLKFQVLNNKL